MQFGHFDDTNKEYVIQTPKTPLPWINYLGMDGFFSLVSNTSGGYSFYKDAKLLRLTRYRWTAMATISISRTAIPSGIPVGSPRKPSWTPMSAATAWAIPVFPLRKMV